MLAIEAQVPGEALDTDSAGDPVMRQRLRQTEGVEAKCEQPPAVGTAVRPRLTRSRAYRVREVPAENPRHVRKYETLEILVGAHVRLEAVRGGIGGYVAGVVEAQLRAQQPLGGGLRRGEDELDVRAAPRLEYQLGAEHGLEALVARAALVDAQHLGDGG